MSGEKRMLMLTKEYMIQERRYQRAKKNAEKHIRRAQKHNGRAQAWITIMKDAVNEQKRINMELKEAGE